MVVSQEYGTRLKFKVWVSTLQRTDNIDDSVQSAKGLSQNPKKKKPFHPHRGVILSSSPFFRHTQKDQKRPKKLLHYF